MSSPVHLRRLPVEDYGLILDLDRQLFESSDPPDIGPHTAWWVLSDHEGDVAYAGAMVWGPDLALYHHRAGVLPRGRKQGLQRRLIHAREQWGRREGCEIAYTYTAHYNVASANNLIRCGYSLWTPQQWGGSSSPMRVTDGIAWLYWQRKIG